MTRSEVRTLVEKFLNEQEPGGNLREIADTDDLLAGGVMDSISFLNLVMFLEQRTGIEIDLVEVDPAELTSIGGICGRFGADK